MPENAPPRHWRGWHATCVLILGSKRAARVPEEGTRSATRAILHPTDFSERSEWASSGSEVPRDEEFAMRREANTAVQGSARLLAGLGVVLLVLAAGVGCKPVEQRNGAEDSDLGALPQEVRDALDRAAQVYPQPLSGARWSKVFVLKKTDHPLYQLQGTNDRGHKVEAELTGAGRIIEVEEHGVPLADVPGAVLKALQEKRPNFKPIEVEAIYQTGQAQPVSYGFEAKDG